MGTVGGGESSDAVERRQPNWGVGHPTPWREGTTWGRSVASHPTTPWRGEEEFPQKCWSHDPTGVHILCDEGALHNFNDLSNTSCSYTTNPRRPEMVLCGFPTKAPKTHPLRRTSPIKKSAPKTTGGNRRRLGGTTTASGRAAARRCQSHVHREPRRRHES